MQTKLRKPRRRALVILALVGLAMVAVPVGAKAAISASAPSPGVPANDGGSGYTDPGPDYQASASAGALIATRFADAYAFAFKDVDDTFVIGFRAEAPAGALTILEGAGGTYRVEENVGFLETDLEDQVNAISRLVSEFIPGGSFDVGAVPDRREMIVTFHGTRSFPAGSEELKARVQALTTLTVQFDTIEGSVSTTSYGLNGGTWLVNPGSGQGVCTTSFVVKRNSGPELGVLSAGHCGTTSKLYYNPTGAHSSYTLDYYSGTYGYEGDYAFYRSPNMMDPWFQKSWPSSGPVGVAVTSSRNPVLNETVCRFGMGSLASLDCGAVQTVVSSFVSNGVTIPGVSQIKSWAQHKDSGGPAYTGPNGSIAVGINVAANFDNVGNPVTTGNGERLWVTRISYALIESA